jgi:hypothetical protein
MAHILKRATDIPMRVGGEEHSGWLPHNALQPLPTPVRDLILDLEIHEVEGGYILYHISRDGSQLGDSWFKTLEETESAAHDWFGIRSSDWQMIDEHE